MRTMTDLDDIIVGREVAVVLSNLELAVIISAIRESGEYLSWDYETRMGVTREEAWSLLKDAQVLSRGLEPYE